MKPSLFLIALCTAALITVPSFAQDQPASPASPPVVTTSPVAAPAGGPPSAADMQKMMQEMTDMQKLNENHKLLADLVGTWNYNIKFWMDPSGKPEESKGTAVRKSMFGGRFFVEDVSGKIQMPGPDGKPKDMDFKGMGIEAYDNVKKKFVATWMDNMGTGIMVAEGTYDPATKTFTYTGEYEEMPGMKKKFREVIKLVDKDHHDFEMYEDRGTGETKSVEIHYTRAKAK